MAVALLFDESPIAISPTLCRALGLPEAVFLQQLYFRLHQKHSNPTTYAKYRVDGMDWVFWTQKELVAEIPLGKSFGPHRRVIDRLREMGILLVRQLKAADWDHTNHYSIDYRKLEEEISRLTNSDVSINMKHLHRSARLMLIDGNESAASVSMSDTVHITENTTKILTESPFQRTTTTQHANIKLHSVCQEYRFVIEKAVSGLDDELAQQVADEIAGAMVSAENGERPKIRGFPGWIKAVANSARNGTFCFQHGKPIARARQNQKRKIELAVVQEQTESANEEARTARNKAIEDLLTSAPQDKLEEFAQLVSQSPSLQNSRQRTATVESVLQRRLPSGPLERSVVTTTLAPLIPDNPQL